MYALEVIVHKHIRIHAIQTFYSFRNDSETQSSWRKCGNGFSPVERRRLLEVPPNGFEVFIRWTGARGRGGGSELGGFDSMRHSSPFRGYFGVASSHFLLSCSENMSNFCQMSNWRLNVNFDLLRILFLLNVFLMILIVKNVSDSCQNYSSRHCNNIAVKF